MQGYKECYSALPSLDFMPLKHSNNNTFIATKSNIKGLNKIQNMLKIYPIITPYSCIHRKPAQPIVVCGIVLYNLFIWNFWIFIL